MGEAASALAAPCCRTVPLPAQLPGIPPDSDAFVCMCAIARPAVSAGINPVESSSSTIATAVSVRPVPPLRLHSPTPVQKMCEPKLQPNSESTPLAYPPLRSQDQLQHSETIAARYNPELRMPSCDNPRPPPLPQGAQLRPISFADSEDMELFDTALDAKSAHTAVRAFIELLLSGVAVRLQVDGCGILNVEAFLDRSLTMLSLVFNSVEKQVPLTSISQVLLKQLGQLEPEETGNETEAGRDWIVQLVLEDDLHCTFVFRGTEAGYDEACYFSDCIRILAEGAKFEHTSRPKIEVSPPSSPSALLVATSEELMRAAALDLLKAGLEIDLGASDFNAVNVQSLDECEKKTYVLACAVAWHA